MYIYIYYKIRQKDFSCSLISKKQLLLSCVQGSRVLLFSQFTIAMDIIEVYLEDRGHRYLRFDGTTKVEER